MKYVVVYEKAPHNYAAYVPDLPGCVATGATRAAVERNIREAIALHLEGLRLGNQRIPTPHAWTELVEVTLA
ncbi:MAG TPA: type II toxin-antitoxin system HicB family antitoxin [Chloroflexota bacterium]|nr:type II toxin-antitoxin system HicB family antitoxin [Chloroflexota bacterium]